MNFGLLLWIEEGAVTSKSSDPYRGAFGRSQNENERRLRWTVCTDVEILPDFLTDGDTKPLAALQGEFTLLSFWG